MYLHFCIQAKIHLQEFPIWMENGILDIYMAEVTLVGLVEGEATKVVVKGMQAMKVMEEVEVAMVGMVGKGAVEVQVA